jgi:hypothetical protein
VDGPLEQARFSRITTLTAGADVLYVVDRGCRSLRSVDLASGQVSTLAGASSRSVFSPGDRASTGLNSLGYMTFDAASDTLYGFDWHEFIVVKFATASS